MASIQAPLRQAKVVRATAADRVRRLTPEQSVFKPALERWSVAEVMEHLAREVHEDELDGVVLPPFPMGPLTIRQGFQFIRWHIEHHLAQIDGVLGNPGFPGPAAGGEAHRW